MHKTPLILLLALALAPQAEAQQVSLLFAGDAMQHQIQLDNALRNGQYDYSSYFQFVKEDISAADIAIVNLETTLGGKPYRGYPQFCSPDDYAAALQNAGFDLFLTANNHILDRRSKGLQRTLNTLDSLHILHTGSFRSLAERQIEYPLLIEKKGIRFAFLNYTYATNGLHPTPPQIVNYIDTAQIARDIRRAQALRADFIVANLHWGIEYRTKPNAEQEKLARQLISQGVHIVIGSHPHVIQPSQTLTDDAGEITHLVVYSLGNLISGMTAAHTDGGQLIRVEVEKREGRTRILSCRYRLVFVDRQPAGNKIDFRLIPVKDFDQKIYRPAALKRFADAAHKLLEAENRGVSEY
jgi:poly-gamma-glutamate synthesis protein (capsule biosynthesis protein)